MIALDRWQVRPNRGRSCLPGSVVPLSRSYLPSVSLRRQKGEFSSREHTKVDQERDCGWKVTSKATAIVAACEVVLSGWALQRGLIPFQSTEKTDEKD